MPSTVRVVRRTLPGVAVCASVDVIRATTRLPDRRLSRPITSAEPSASSWPAVRPHDPAGCCGAASSIGQISSPKLSQSGFSHSKRVEPRASAGSAVTPHVGQIGARSSSPSSYSSNNTVPACRDCEVMSGATATGPTMAPCSPTRPPRSRCGAAHLTRCTFPAVIHRSSVVLLSLLVAIGLAGVQPAHAVRSVDDLLDAKVPALCRQQAGVLVDGVLPGSPIGESLSLSTSLSSTGNLWGTKRSEALAVLQCVLGPSAAFDYLVVYSATGKPVKAWDVGKLTRAGGSVVGTAIRNRVARVTVSGIQQLNEAPCCATADAIVTVRWNTKKKSVVARSRLITEKRTVTQLVAALNAGDVTRAGRFSDPVVVEALMDFRRAGSKSFSLCGCYGGDSFYESERTCDITTPVVDVLLHVDRTGFADWNVSAYQLLD